MKLLRGLLDRVAPYFHKGGKLEKLYPLFEVTDTFFYTSGEVTPGRCHVRDANDMKRTMSVVLVALMPCVLMAMFNTGLQANTAMAGIEAVSQAPGKFLAPCCLPNPTRTARIARAAWRTP